MDNILTVAELTQRLARVLERAFEWVWVRGEVTDISRPSSGHLYFSLKGGGCLLRCVWFKGAQGRGAFDALTGEVREGPGLADTLDNGQEVLMAGRVRVYGARGSYQLVVEAAQGVGEGALYQEFEKLKQKLGAQGYFAQERKRALPQEPECVAVVTAMAGAAIRDFLRIGGGRGLGGTVRIYPSLVQGNGAAGEIAAAIRQAEQWAQVVVLIRGGGSLQDLWAFNEEEVARAVYECRVPVLTGVGHQVDNSIADFVADVAAATPSHAAQLLWPEREGYAQAVDELENALKASMGRAMRQRQQNVLALCRALDWLSPKKTFEAKKQALEAATLRLERAWQEKAATQGRNVENAAARLARFGENAFFAKSALHDALEKRLQGLWDKELQARFARLENLRLRLQGSNPEAPLERGYALLRGVDGGFVKSVEQLGLNEDVLICMTDGEALSRIKEIRKK